MAIITDKSFSKIRKNNLGKKIVYCSGTFDLTHAGHILFFEDCKKNGDILVVAVGKDHTIRKIKGKQRPILNHHLRLKMIDSLRAVDYCLLSGFWKSSHPLSILEKVFQELKPDIYAINDDAFDIPFRRKISKKHGVKLVVLKRTCPPEFDNISTSKIIEKIKKN